MESLVKTETSMLPDWEIEASKETIKQAIRAYENRRVKPAESIGIMIVCIETLQRTFERAKPTKQEKFY